MEIWGKKEIVSCHEISSLRKFRGKEKLSEVDRIYSIASKSLGWFELSFSLIWTRQVLKLSGEPNKVSG